MAYAESYDLDQLEVGNRNYHSQLAESLLSNLGYEDAVDFCVSNEWTGVLTHLMAH